MDLLPVARRVLHACSVPTCGNHERRSPEDTFYYLPEVDTVRMSWIEKCHLRFKWERLGIKPLFSDTDIVVCSQHFSDSDYCTSNTGPSQRILKPDAIPSLDLPPEDFQESLGIRKIINRTAKQITSTLQLEKLCPGTVYTIKDYTTALLQTCMFANRYKKKCHTCKSSENRMGLLILGENAKWRLSSRAGIPYDADAIQNICYFHEFMAFKNYFKCCDPLRKHELGRRKISSKVGRASGIGVVNFLIYDKVKHFAPRAAIGEPICKACIADVYYRLPKKFQQKNVATTSSQSTLNSANGVGSAMAVEEAVSLLLEEMIATVAMESPFLEEKTGKIVAALPLSEDATSVNGCTKTEQKFVCDACGLELANKVSLVEHLMYLHLHELTLPMCCEYCNKAFDTRVIYNSHKLSHRKDMLKQSSSVRRSTLRDKSQKASFICCFCVGEFNTKSDMDMHKHQCTRIHQVLYRKLEKTFQHSPHRYSPTCSTTTCSTAGGNEHYISHVEYDYKKCCCPLCGIGFDSIVSLIQHHIAKHLPRDQPVSSQPTSLVEPDMMSISFLHKLLDVYISY